MAFDALKGKRDAHSYMETADAVSIDREMELTLERSRTQTEHKRIII
jgi:hypothetical protein